MVSLASGHLPNTCVNILFLTPLYDHLQTRENLEIELEVLGDLCSTFEGMMEALGEATLDDR